MARRILVVPVNNDAGVTVACLGLVHALVLRHVSVGYCKPFAQARRGPDHSTELIRLATSLRPPQPIAVEELEYRLAGGYLTGVMSRVVELTAELDADKQILVLEGLAPTADQAYADRINIEIAAALDAEVLLVGALGDQSPERFAEQLAGTERIYRVRGDSRVIGAVANHVPVGGDHDRIAIAIADRGMRCAAVVEDHSEFTQARVGDIVRELDLKVLSQGDQARRIATTVIAAQSIPGFLSSLTEGALVVAPGDRHEVLLSAALAETGGTKLAGLLLTAGVEPDPDVLRLVEPALVEGLPLLLSYEKTFPTTQAIVTIDRDIPADDEERARTVMETVADGYLTDFLVELPRGEGSTRVTPAQFQHTLREEMRKGRIRLALTDGADPRILRAVTVLQRYEALQFTLVADKAELETHLGLLGMTLPLGTHVVDPAAGNAPGMTAVQAALTEAGYAADPADPLVRALALLADGQVDGVVGGITEDQATFLASVRSVVPLASDVHVLSAAQAVMLPDEVIFLADALINAHPDAAALASIAAQTAETARLCGIAPRITFVSPSSWSPTAQHDRQTIEGARMLLGERRPDLPTGGPLPFQEAVKRTGNTDGDSTVFVFADIASATATARAIGQSGGAVVHPPVLQGLARAVSLLPKDAGVDNVMDVIVYTAVKAAQIG